MYNDDSISDILQLRDTTAFKLYEHYKTQAKTNPSSELYINIETVVLRAQCLIML